VETLISIHGKIDEDFMKNVGKQGTLSSDCFNFNFLFQFFGLGLVFILIF